MANILVTTSSFGKFDEGPVKRLRNAGGDIHLNPFGRKLTETEILDLIERYQPVGLIAGVEPLTRNVLQAAKRLKAISRCGIGMESVDLDAAEELDIRVTNTPDGPTVAVAELTIGMILSLLRKIHISDAGIRNGRWIRPMGNLLYGKTIGIIGCGRIGKCLAARLEMFGCRILGYDPAVNKSEHLEIVGMDHLIVESDIVTLHIPGGKNNCHIIDRKQIGAMKKGSFLVNTARGDLVDESALVEALQSGHIAGAALDVYEKEPYSGPLASFENVLLTGHIGSYAIEGRVMMEMQAVENLLVELNKHQGASA